MVERVQRAEAFATALAHGVDRALVSRVEHTPLKLNLRLCAHLLACRYSCICSRGEEAVVLR